MPSSGEQVGNLDSLHSVWQMSVRLIALSKHSWPPTAATGSAISHKIDQAPTFSPSFLAPSFISSGTSPRFSCPGSLWRRDTVACSDHHKDAPFVTICPRNCSNIRFHQEIYKVSIGSEEEPWDPLWRCRNVLGRDWCSYRGSRHTLWFPTVWDYNHYQAPLPWTRNLQAQEHYPRYQLSQLCPQRSRGKVKDAWPEPVPFIAGSSTVD